MKPRQQRLLLLGLGLAGLAAAAALLFSAFQKNLVFFYTPSQVLQGEAPKGRSFRIGGLVESGSVQRGADGLSHRFIVTDQAQRVPVQYHGFLPDLFKEGRGVVAQGRLHDSQDQASTPSLVFVADEVLAKHDENYMPPEAAHALEQAGQKGQTP